MSEPPADACLLEMLLLSSAVPLNSDDLGRVLPQGFDIYGAITSLNRDYAHRSLEVAKVAGGWTVRTKPEYSDLCRALMPKPPKLSKAANETLSVIAAFQPVTRPEIERIRGVSLAKGTLDLLIWTGWVRPSGRRQGPGNPLTFVTTDAFLRHFGLDDIDGIPIIGRMREEGLLDAQKDIGLKQDAETE